MTENNKRFLIVGFSGFFLGMIYVVFIDMLFHFRFTKIGSGVLSWTLFRSGVLSWVLFGGVVGTAYSYSLFSLIADKTALLEKSKIFKNLLFYSFAFPILTLFGISCLIYFYDYFSLRFLGNIPRLIFFFGIFLLPIIGFAFGYRRLKHDF